MKVLNIKKLSIIPIVLTCAACSGNLKAPSKPFSLDSRLDSIEDDFSSKDKESNNLFLDRASDYGLKGVPAQSINVVDINGDDYSDLVLIPTFYDEPRFYYFNILKQKFELGRSPFLKGVKASFVQFYDINNDKILDAIVGVLNQKTEMSKEPLRVFFGKKSKTGELNFVQHKFNIQPSPNSSVGLVDYNLDGKLDLFIGNWFAKKGGNHIPQTDFLFKNTGKTFENISSSLIGENKQNPVKTMNVNATPTYGVQVCDMDQNGYPDILTTSTNGYKNKMWLNRYKFREKYRYFQDFGQVSSYAGDPEGMLNNQGGGRSFALACADYNNDGIMDVFLGELTHNYDNDGVDRSSILTGRSLKFPPKFYRTEYFQDSFDPNWHQADRRGVWADMNNDGLLDLIVDNSGYPPHTKLIVFEQAPDHSFENVANKWNLDLINPISTVISDINRDGKLDIITARSNIRDDSLVPQVFIFENNLDIGKNRSMRFYLRGESSNFHGLNALVILKVKTPEGIVYRRQNVSYSYGAFSPQNEEGVHFGLAENEKVLGVKVRWPFSKKANENRAALEKYYPINLKFNSYMNITLCEKGNFLIGRRQCPRS